MSLTIEATYENGVLRPVRPLPFKEHEKVLVTVTASSTWVDLSGARASTTWCVRLAQLTAISWS